MNLKERAEVALQEYLEASLLEQGVKPEDAKCEAGYVASKTVNLFNISQKSDSQNPYF